jgi:hypothetical protein
MFQCVDNQTYPVVPQSRHHITLKNLLSVINSEWSKPPLREVLHRVGMPPADVISRIVFKVLLRGGHRDRPAHLASQLPSPKSSWCRESRMLARSGERRLIRWNCLKLPADEGKMIGKAAIADEITDHHQEESRIAVAQSVEAQEQLNLLTSNNCDENQGYRRSKPVTDEVFATKFLVHRELSHAGTTSGRDDGIGA